MTVMDLDIMKVKDDIEKIFGGKISNKFVGFRRSKVENWASIQN